MAYIKLPRLQYTPTEVVNHNLDDTQTSIRLVSQAAGASAISCLTEVGTTG